MLLVSLLFGAPSSTNFTLKSYDFGTGGGSTSSTNYKLDALTGSQTGNGTQNSTNYKVLGGELSTQHANVPPAAALTNPSNDYNRLKLVLNTGTNPTDTKYQVAISPDGFATSTQYVQTDNTVGSANGVATYQTYAGWGSASGVWVVGLASNTTYSVKVRSWQGGFTGSPFGPVASAATVGPTITFTVGTSLTPTPPYAVAFSSLAAGVVSSGNATINVGLTTNAQSGGIVYIKSANAGLNSASAAATLATASADLSASQSGYGALVSSVSQASGGPLVATAPYNGTANNVGALSVVAHPVLTTSAPITTGASTITLKAKADSTTPSANDYTDTITLIAAMQF